MNENNYKYDTKLPTIIFIAICEAVSFFPTWSLVIILCILDILQIIMIVVNFVAEMAVSSYQLHDPIVAQSVAEFGMN